MKIYAKCPPTKHVYLTSGKEYEVLHECEGCFHVVDDVGDMIVEGWIDGIHTGGDWERIVRDDVGEDTLTVRDRFAMAALPHYLGKHPADRFTVEKIAEASYQVADAMMEARKK